MAQSGNVTNQQVIDVLFLIAHQFATDDPAKLNTYYLLLDQLRCMYNPKFWCCSGALALANLLAHYLTIANNPTTGTLSNMSEGELSIGYATSADQGFFELSPYGKAFQMMRRQLKAGPIVTTGALRTPGALAWGPFYGTPFGPCC